MGLVSWVANTLDKCGLDAMADVTRATSVALGADKEPCGIKKGANGTVTADIDYDKVPKEQIPDIKYKANMLATELTKKQEQLATCKDPKQIAELERDIANIENGLADVKYHCEVGEIGLGEAILMGVLGTAMPGVGIFIADALIDTQADMDDVNQSLHIATKGAGYTVEPQHDGTLLDTVPSPSGKDKASSSSPNQTEGSPSTASSDAAPDFLEMVNLAQSDPDAFMAKMKDMPEGQRQAMQYAMQQHNQMWSTMTNLLKADHDTKKAIINNMRV